MPKERWNWKRWQTIVSDKITDPDALKLAEAWPVFAKTQHGKRGMWAQEMMYPGAPLEEWEPLPGDATPMHRIMKAANVLEAAGLSSRCPGTPLYVPTMLEESDEREAAQ